MLRKTTLPSQGRLSHKLSPRLDIRMTRGIRCRLYKSHLWTNQPLAVAIDSEVHFPIFELPARRVFDPQGGLPPLGGSPLSFQWLRKLAPSHILRREGRECLGGATSDRNFVPPQLRLFMLGTKLPHQICMRNFDGRHLPISSLLPSLPPLLDLAVVYIENPTK